ncbi:hypothetical protein PN462_06195 [Spirulina sp. CS-785/01]|uniref:hypothetical protein n=1 Tax=Spirulina sp. CS-785/01 TaxID=3021716 RepID=UPI00232C826F|nr:hypothetical protein [Spirulina sp. CS-785/01]MDB9312684.1 hypothetical protein [Spirulina sp. CS-785/01]
MVAASPGVMLASSPMVTSLELRKQTPDAMVSLDYWTPAEQEFILEYMTNFISQSAHLPEPPTEEMQQALYNREETQTLLDNARKVCRGESSQWGNSWDNFVMELNSFSELCAE